MPVSLDFFLASKGTGAQAIVAEATACIDLLAGEELLAVGSLVEGLATVKSDLDLLLLSIREATELPDRLEISWASGRCLVDMRILGEPFLSDLLARFSRWSEAHWDPTFAPPFSAEERGLLHRIAVGTRLVGGDDTGREARPRPDLGALARLKLHAARHEARTVQVDMAGLRHSKDFRSLCFAAAQLMGLAVDAILAGHGLTNPLPKWRSRLLEKVPEGWRPGTLPRVSGSAGDLVWKLSVLPRSCSADSALRFALRISAFARAAFLWAEDALLRVGEDTIAPYVEEPVDASPPALPFLDFDIDFSIAPDAVYLGRLNDFGDPLVISRSELDAALLFDGETSAGEADKMILRGRGETLSTADLRERCAAHGLLAFP